MLREGEGGRDLTQERVNQAPIPEVLALEEADQAASKSRYGCRRFDWILCIPFDGTEVRPGTWENMRDFLSVHGLCRPPKPALLLLLSRNTADE